jgi:hypothetical protein
MQMEWHWRDWASPHAFAFVHQGATHRCLSIGPVTFVFAKAGEQ